MKLVIKVLVFAAQCTLLFGLWKSATVPHRIRFHLEDDERLILHKDYPLAAVKVLPHRPVIDNKFYTQLLKINKKPKYVKNTFGGKLKSSLTTEGDKKCCGNQWETGKGNLEVGVPFEELFQPVALPAPHIHGYDSVDDIKPVTEEIEDDLKYDFRTKTHSF